MQTVKEISKKLFFIYIFLGITAGLALFPPAAGAADTFVISGSGGSVNIRGGPGTDYPVVATVKRGSKLALLGQQSGWYKITLSTGKTGWVASWLGKLVEEKKVSPTVPGNTASQTVLIAQGVINLRSGPATKYAIVGKTSNGQKLISLGKQGEWYKVSLSGGKSAWIAGWLVKAQTAPPPASDRGGNSAGGQVLVAQDVINLRSGPGTGYSIVGRTTKGQKLISLGKQGDWYKVSLSGGKSAWIAGWLVKPEAPGEASAGEAVIAQQVLILRSGPGSDYGTSGSIEKGQRLLVLDKRGEWYRVSHSSGQTGWIAVTLVSRAPGQSTPPPAQQPDFVPRVFNTPIRVALSTDAFAAAISATGDYLITNGLTGEVLSQPVSSNVFTFSVIKLSGSTVDQVVYAVQVEKDRTPLGTYTGPIMLTEGQGATGNWFELNVNGSSRRYRGSLGIRLQNGCLLLVNELPLEEYLYGVVPCEMPYNWAAEALKAQAVAARSYAFYALKYAKGQYYDVFATQASQVYRGMNAEYPSTTAAVDATRNLVLTSGGYVVPAYFCSSNGGWSENSEDVWKNYAGPIRGKADPYDRHPENPHYGWSVTYTVYELPRLLQERGYDFSVVTEVYISGRTTVGGRIKQVQVLGTGADGIQRFQDLANADWVRTVFQCKAPVTDLLKEYDPLTGALVGVTFTGSGWGHDLGMSQWGARAMAEQGCSFKDILDFYYTGGMLDLTTNIHS
ncbi:MAG: SpoIID/LytB domain-containing protein [Bacillota bacterium]